MVSGMLNSGSRTGTRRVRVGRARHRPPAGRRRSRSHYPVQSTAGGINEVTWDEINPIVTRALMPDVTSATRL